MRFVEQMKTQGHRVESTCAILREQGSAVAPRSYRAWRRRKPSVRTIADATLTATSRRGVIAGALKRRGPWLLAPRTDAEPGCKACRTELARCLPGDTEQSRENGCLPRVPDENDGVDHEMRDHPERHPSIAHAHTIDRDRDKLFRRLPRRIARTGVTAVVRTSAMATVTEAGTIAVTADS